MKRFVVMCLIFSMAIMALSSCAIFRKPIDNWANFSGYLKETEEYIRQEKWPNALESLEKAHEAWLKIKPIMQVDIDHDYVNDMEEDFTVLKGYIETKEKSDSLATVLLLQKTWKNIGEM